MWHDFYRNIFFSFLMYKEKIKKNQKSNKFYYLLCDYDLSHYIKTRSFKDSLPLNNTVQ